MAPSKKLVLYSPQSCRERSQPPYVRWTQELPLSLLTIAAWPMRDGYEVVLIDGSRYEQDEAHRRVLEACEGALLYATTGILGYQVADGSACTRRVRARFPDLPRFVGGWFAGAAPELHLEGGLYDAVALGQGELTFRELIEAVASGAPLDGVAGLALWRDGGMVKTAPRAVVGWDRLLNCPWELLDFELYRRPQLREKNRGTIRRGYGQGRARFELSYYSSFGCPLACTFCCSPEFTGQRWKAMPAPRMLDDLADLQARSGFDGLTFYEANFGVSLKRLHVFSQGLVDRGLRFDWFAYMQAESILRAQSSTLDLMAEASMFNCLIGAESGTDEAMERMKKPTRGDDNLRAAMRLEERGIGSFLTYIVGFPDEDTATMLATIEQARQVTLACPLSRPEVWPYRPVPGTADYRRALELGYVPPATLDEWGLKGDYWAEEGWPGHIPREVSRARYLFMHYSSLAQGRVRERHGFWERRAAARLARNDCRSGELEARAFHLYHAVERKLFPHATAPVMST
jgi:radical SAM superfamily enzyme YgiQ (UPF0313 family)